MPHCSLRLTIKVLFAARGDNLSSDSDYILLESDISYWRARISNQVHEISNRVQCDSINSNNTSHASACIQIKIQEQFNEAYSNSTLPNH